MKALKIAKKIDEYVRDYGCSNGTINLLDDLIDELEELKNRSCYECKHWCQEFQAIGICCKGIKEEKQFRESMTYSNFYCNKWESK